MLDCLLTQRCPHCGYDVVLQVLYGYLDMLSPTQCDALQAGTAVFGGNVPKWDWEEEPLNVQCLRCRHEWYRKPMPTPN